MTTQKTLMKNHKELTFLSITDKFSKLKIQIHSIQTSIKNRYVMNCKTGNNPLAAGQLFLFNDREVTNHIVRLSLYF
jgi:hypothetical protein